jgi:phage shock protein A
MLSTLRTLFRASAFEAEEAIIENNGPKILGQHLRDAEADTQRARQVLAGLLARQKAVARALDALMSEKSRREEEARQALDAEDEALATDLADRVVFLEDEIGASRSESEDLTKRIASLRISLSQADRRIASLASELRAARASAACRVAKTGLAEGMQQSSLERAEAMASRVRESSQRIEDEIGAYTDLRRSTGNDLDARVDEAGLGNATSARRDAILKRLKSKSDT